MVIKNEWLGKLIIIPDGNEICPRCKGNGFNPDLDDNGIHRFKCWVCQGNGFIDWIERITYGEWKKTEEDYNYAEEEVELEDEYYEELADMKYGSFDCNN